MDTEVRRSIKLGKECFDNKNYTKAERYFSDVVKKYSNFADVYNMLGLIYHEQGKFGKAHKAFEKALKLNPNYIEASLNLAVTYNDLGKYKQAKEIYTRAKKVSQEHAGGLDPFAKGKLANMHAEIGDIYKGIGMYDDAVEEFKKALILRPKFIDIKTKLADTYREQGNVDKAIKEYLDAKKISRHYPQIGINLGIAYYTEGKTAKAKSEWKEVLVKDPNNKSAKMYLKLVRPEKKK